MATLVDKVLGNGRPVEVSSPEEATQFYQDTRNSSIVKIKRQEAYLLIKFVLVFSLKQARSHLRWTNARQEIPLPLNPAFLEKPKLWKQLIG